MVIRGGPCAALHGLVRVQAVPAGGIPGPLCLPGPPVCCPAWACATPGRARWWESGALCLPDPPVAAFTALSEQRALPSATAEVARGGVWERPAELGDVCWSAHCASARAGTLLSWFSGVGRCGGEFLVPMKVNRSQNLGPSMSDVTHQVGAIWQLGRREGSRRQLRRSEVGGRGCQWRGLSCGFPDGRFFRRCHPWGARRSRSRLPARPHSRGAEA